MASSSSKQGYCSTQAISSINVSITVQKLISSLWPGRYSTCKGGCRKTHLLLKETTALSIYLSIYIQYLFKKDSVLLRLQLTLSQLTMILCQYSSKKTYLFSNVLMKCIGLLTVGLHIDSTRKLFFLLDYNSLLQTT